MPQRTPHAAIGVLCLTGVLIIISGCATTRTPEPDTKVIPSSEVSPPRPLQKPLESAPDYTAAVEQRLRDEIERWEGTPHRWGGTGRDGVDCSGLMMVLYADVFGLRLPRTTTEQASLGERVRADELQPGDLVFFKPAKSQHVGVYLSNGEFAHASLSKGVTISDIGQAYWQEAYWTAQRVLPLSATPATANLWRAAPAQIAAEEHREPEPAQVTTGSKSTVRTGW